MYHIALVNITDKKIIVAEAFDTQESAAERIRMGYAPQKDLEAIGSGSYGGPGKDFQIYGPADKPFEWPSP